MGLGDDMMFLGEAERIHKETGKMITPLYNTGFNSLYENVEFITKNGGLTVNARDTDLKSDVHVNYYESHKEQTILGTRVVFKPYKPKPFRVRLYQSEIDLADKIIKENNLHDFVIVNPDYKSSFFSDNKRWGFKKWQELTNKLSQTNQVVRLKPPPGQYNEPLLENAINLDIDQVRLVAAISSKAKMGVTYDGLLHHIFAGFDIPGVIIHGGLTSPEILSYEGMLYITYEHPLTPCGSTFNCMHCDEANKAITVDMVYEKCQSLL